jgi:hypothetical protein
MKPTKLSTSELELVKTALLTHLSQLQQIERDDAPRGEEAVDLAFEIKSTEKLIQKLEG